MWLGLVLPLMLPLMLMLLSPSIVPELLGLLPSVVSPVYLLHLVVLTVG